MKNIPKINLFIPIACVIILSIISTFVVSTGLPIPDRFQYYVASFSATEPVDVEIHSIYSLIRAPIFEVIDFIFLDYKLFILFTYLLHILLSVLLFYLLMKLSKNSF